MAHPSLRPDLDRHRRSWVDPVLGRTERGTSAWRCRDLSTGQEALAWGDAHHRDDAYCDPGVTERKKCRVARASNYGAVLVVKPMSASLRHGATPMLSAIEIRIGLGQCGVGCRYRQMSTFGICGCGLLLHRGIAASSRVPDPGSAWRLRRLSLERAHPWCLRRRPISHGKTTIASWQSICVVSGAACGMR